MARLQNKVALITGAGAGIGRCAATLFASEGAAIVVAERNADAGRETVALVEQAGGRALFVETDVGVAESVERAVARGVETFGALHILYNNAGGSSPHDGPVTEAPLDEFWRVMQVDLYGVWLGCRYAIPAIAAAGGGSVINAASISGMMGKGGRDAYTAAKGGIISLTRSMAVEYAPKKIRVNAIAPGVTMTERVAELWRVKPQGQAVLDRHVLGVCEPMDIANAALFLASDEARRITGHTLPVDSGITMC